MGYAFSKVQGPTDSSAGVNTQVGSDYIVPPGGPFFIHDMTVGKGNVTNAKENSGIISVTVTSVTGTFQYAYGNGSGGATNNAQNIAAEPITCRIPTPSGSTVKIYVLDAETAKNVVVAAAFWNGQEVVDSYEAGGAGSDTTASTELTVGTITVVNRPGRIKQIRFAGSGVVDADAGSGKLVIDVPGQGYPQEFSVGNGPGGATLGGAAWADVIDVDIGVGKSKIPVNTVVTVKLTTPEIMLSATCSLAIA